VSIYADYTPDEQQVLRASLQAAAMAVSAASLGRKEETVSEGFAAASYVLGSQPEYVANTLVTSLLVELENRLKTEHVFPDFEHAAYLPGALDGAIDNLRAVAELLDRKSTPDEARGYKEWLMRIATVTAQAGKEDQGFLGSGGVAVNDAERSELAKIRDVLGLGA
jgi:hypothetical protein